ncbi:sugar transferase [Eubacterium sp. 1001713B170207_170306_E7]|uniref:sugar transferase n=1 Tax=Eubacterium sp. 1001713B170207_170306_E7 TaxID=2787097 RepID=UPI00189721EB|nr:sugar transferase [Eubacterium sp. 1001713B170207_170306_E7]
MFYKNYLKYMLDICVAALVLAALLPLFVVIAAAIRLDSAGPVFFRQVRCGQDGKAFVIYKFRSMYQTAPRDRAVKELENPERYITRTGRVLRNTSLDELPQLFNIIKGEMSLIGPRPVPINEQILNEARQRTAAGRLRPGITGWAQINGRDRVSIYQKVALDCVYAEGLSFRMDMMIFLRTILYVVRRQDIFEKMPDEDRRIIDETAEGASE